MRILLLGDAHGDVRFMEKGVSIARAQDCSWLVQLGDFGFGWDPRYAQDVARAAEQAAVPVCWLDGNHENFAELKVAVERVEMLRRAGLGRSDPIRVEDWELLPWLMYLPRGFRWEWDDVTFMALGGANSIDKAYRKEGESWWPDELITDEDEERAIGGGPCDIMLTHDVPTGVDMGIQLMFMHDRPDRENRDRVRRVCDKVKPKLLVHGHYHHHYENMLEGHDYRTRVIGLSATLQNIEADRSKWQPGGSFVLDLKEFKREKDLDRPHANARG